MHPTTTYIVVWRVFWEPVEIAQRLREWYICIARFHQCHARPLCWQFGKVKWSEVNLLYSYFLVFLYRVIQIVWYILCDTNTHTHTLSHSLNVVLLGSSFRSIARRDVRAPFVRKTLRFGCLLVWVLLSVSRPVCLSLSVPHFAPSGMFTAHYTHTHTNCCAVRLIESALCFCPLTTTTFSYSVQYLYMCEQYLHTEHWTDCCCCWSPRTQLATIAPLWASPW